MVSSCVLLEACDLSWGKMQRQDKTQVRGGGRGAGGRLLSASKVISSETLSRCHQNITFTAALSHLVTASRVRTLPQSLRRSYLVLVSTAVCWKIAKIFRKEVRISSLIDNGEHFSEFWKVWAVMLWWDDSPAKQWDKKKNTTHQAILVEQSKKFYFKEWKI